MELLETVDIVVPLYNQLILETPVVEKFIEKKDVCFYLCDNSTEETIKSENLAVSKAHPQIRYIDMHGNRGLPKAYNAAIDRVAGDIVCIFDDDTEPMDDFLDKVRLAVHSDGIFLPVVKDGSKVLSPLRTVGPAIFPEQDLDRIDMNTCSAFNAGMSFSREKEKRLRYNEKQFIEYVDHDICRRAHQQGIAFHLMRDVVLQQDYSAATDDLEAALHRNRVGGQDVREYYSKGIINRFYGWLYLLYKALRNTLRYRTLRFLTGK